LYLDFDLLYGPFLEAQPVGSREQSSDSPLLFAEAFVSDVKYTLMAFTHSSMQNQKYCQLFWDIITGCVPLTAVNRPKERSDK